MLRVVAPRLEALKATAEVSRRDIYIRGWAMRGITECAYVSGTGGGGGAGVVGSDCSGDLCG